MVPDSSCGPREDLRREDLREAAASLLNLAVHPSHRALPRLSDRGSRTSAQHFEDLLRQEREAAPLLPPPSPIQPPLTYSQRAIVPIRIVLSQSSSANASVANSPSGSGAATPKKDDGDLNEDGAHSDGSDEWESASGPARLRRSATLFDTAASAAACVTQPATSASRLVRDLVRSGKTLWSVPEATQVCRTPPVSRQPAQEATSDRLRLAAVPEPWSRKQRRSKEEADAKEAASAKEAADTKERPGAAVVDAKQAALIARLADLIIRVEQGDISDSVLDVQQWAAMVATMTPEQYAQAKALAKKLSAEATMDLSQ